MTTIPISPDRWTIDGLDLSSHATLVTELDGGEDLPPMRGENVIAPGSPGRRHVPKLDDAKRFALALWISQTNATGGWDGGVTSDDIQVQRNLDALRAILGKRHALRTIVHYLPDGTSRTATGECVSFRVSDSPAGRGPILAVADFELPDPYFYGADTVDASRAIASSPTAFTLTHPGTARTWRGTLDFLGPIANPRILNQTNAIYVECLVTVAATKHLIIDLDAFTAANDGVAAGGSIRHSGDARWLVLEPGANALRVTGTGLSAATRLTTTLKTPYEA
jgi:hypothetical protein